ncbi:MAG: signal peptidase I [Bacteroidales bacterium]
MSKNHLSYTILKDIGFSLLAEGKIIRVRAEGYSMYPAIKPGSVIYIKPLQEETSLPGDIIAVKRESGFVVHRCIRNIEKEGKKYIITRGDSIMAEDDPVDYKDIAGTVIRVETPQGKTVEAEKLTKKHVNYALNRLLVRIMLQFRRFKNP